jgi:hypothetical protein
MKKIIAILGVVVILVAVPLTVFILQQQTQTRIGAAKATTMSLTGPSSITVDQQFDITITISPREPNAISFIKLTLTYDGTKLQPVGSGLSPISLGTDRELITLETAKFNASCTDPVCPLTMTLSIGADPNKAIRTTTTVAKATFKALSPTTAGAQTQITANGTQLLSLGAADQVSENVLSSDPSPVRLTISGAAVSPTQSPTAGPTQGAPTPTPRSSGSSTAPGVPQAGTQATPTPTLVSCSSLSASTTRGPSPLTLTLTTTGSGQNNISRIVFNFGDTTVQTVTSGGGIGSRNINLQQQHTYANPGVYTATATFTDDAGNVSNPTSCSQTITVTSADGSTPQGSTIPPTGSTTALLAGVAAAAIVIIGAAVMFGL